MKILFIGTDDVLDWTRREVLSSAGYEVVRVGGGSAVEPALGDGVTVAVISSLIDPEEQERIAKLIRAKSPETVLIILGKETATVGETVVPALSDPNELLKQVGVAWMKQHQHPEVSGEYVLYVDRARRYIYVSDGVCRLTKWRREEILGKKIEWLTYPASADAPAMFQQYLADGRMAGSYQLRSRSGEPVRVRYAAAVLADGCMCSELTPE